MLGDRDRVPPARGPASLVAAIFLSLSACTVRGDGSSSETLVVGEDVRLEGRVTEIDPTPMFVDGDGEITLDTDSHGRVLIRVPAGERPCMARGLDAFHALAPGDEITVVGLATDRSEVTVCESEAHLLERTGRGSDARDASGAPGAQQKA